MRLDVCDDRPEPLAGRFQYEWEDGTEPSEAIVAALAAVTGVRPANVGPLAERLDPDSLDALLTERNAPAAVSFECDGVRVRVATDGTIELQIGPG